MTQNAHSHFTGLCGFAGGPQSHRNKTRRVKVLKTL